jgi:nucleosome binding factor SPN SPT16 subunit
MFSYVSVMACVCPYNKQVLVDWLVGYHLLSRVIILTNVCVVITVAMGKSVPSFTWRETRNAREVSQRKTRDLW